MLENADLNIAIESKNLRKTYNDKIAVNNVSIKVIEGEFISLLGPSGCGKTTLLRMLAGLEFPDKGAIFLGGREVTTEPAYSRDSNMVFQQLALFPHLNVWQNIAYGLRVKGESRSTISEKVKAVLALVRLEEYSQRKIQELSGGQAQRVAIARALVNKPKVLFLDEPLSALDQKLRESMQIELKRIQRESNATFIFVTHDQNEAIAISDRIAVMNNGELLQYGRTKEIYEEPINEFVATFIGDTNLLNVTVTDITDNGVFLSYHNEKLTTRNNNNLTLQKGQIIKLSIRHEYVKITKDSVGFDNSIDAQIIEARYGGTNIHYKLKLSTGDFIDSRETILPGEKVYLEGEEVKVNWNRKDGLLLNP